MEARWIRDLRSPEDCVAEMHRRVLIHLAAYDRILTLRAFDTPSLAVRYELWEIPVTVLGHVASLAAVDFVGPSAKSGSARATVCMGGTAVFDLVLDGSVEKVTIRGLRTEFCRLHSWWEVPSALSPD